MVKKKVVLIEDHVVGHIRQCEAIYYHIVEYYKRRKAIDDGAELLSLQLNTKIQHGWLKKTMHYFMHPRYAECEGCDRCVRMITSPEDYRRLLAVSPDIVVSPFGKRTTLITRWLARRCRAKSIVLMNPRQFQERYDLVVIPRHDVVEAKPNMVVTEGAPNAVRLRALSPAALSLRNEFGQSKTCRIGLLLGGDYKTFRMQEEKIDVLIRQVREVAGILNAELFITTSRRTPRSIERAVKFCFTGESSCRLLVIASENNRPEVVPALLGLCRLVLVSPESISMISEAATSDAHVLVYEDDDFLDDKHRRFLANLKTKGFIHTESINRIAQKILEVSRLPAKEKSLNDGEAVLEGLSRIL